ncbi:MAG: hypothetical protein V4538_02385 [Bacteroidota bacterium]
MATLPLMKAMDFTIPANAPSGVAISFDFEHESEDGLRVFAMGLVETANQDDKHWNFKLEAELGTSTIDSVSKKFLATTEQTPLDNRFLPIEFVVPGTKKSKVYLTPTVAVAANPIKVQVVFKYRK